MHRSASRIIARLRRIGGFGGYLDTFDARQPFRKAGQLEWHVRTIRLRAELGSVERCLASDGFLETLWQTLQAWGIGARSSRLVSLERFMVAVRGQLAGLSQLEPLTIGDTKLDVAAAGERVWSVVAGLGIVENANPTVACTKALHHILPDLVVPFDRAFTQVFFGWHNPEFQGNPQRVFAHAFAHFAEIARATRPEQYVGAGWRSSRTKVLDDAVVGYCLAEGLATAWGGS